MLLLLLACVHLRDVSAGPTPGEFYALVGESVLRCKVQGEHTTCTRVLVGVNTTLVDAEQGSSATTPE